MMANPGDSGFIICGMCNEIAADQEGEGEKPETDTRRPQGETGGFHSQDHLPQLLQLLVNKLEKGLAASHQYELEDSLAYRT
jgi:hypothetical protein